MHRHRSIKRTVLSAALLAVCSGGSTARADAIAPRPACPPGSRGQSSHAGQWCAAATCKTDEDCKVKGSTCRNWRVCVRDAKASHHRRRPAPTTTTLVVGTCAPDKKCRGDEEPPPPLIGTLEKGTLRCVTARHCVPASLPPMPQTKPKPKPKPGSNDDDDEDEKESRRAAPRTRSKGCGCRSSGPVATATAPLLFIAALLFFRRRRS